MTATSAVRFQVVEVGSRRVVQVAPGGRPDLRLPQARPDRAPQPGRVGVSVSSCSVAAPAPKVSPLLALKVAGVGVLALIGAVVSVQNLAFAEPDPAQQYVAGDPAWAHVTQP